MAVFPFQYVNRRGIPVIKTTGVTVNAADVVFSFQNHAFANSWYRGIVLVELSQAIPAGTTGTLPVLFETNGVTKNVTTYNGANVTVSDIPGTGVFQLFYDKQTDTLQLIEQETQARKDAAARQGGAHRLFGGVAAAHGRCAAAAHQFGIQADLLAAVGRDAGQGAAQG